MIEENDEGKAEYQPRYGQRDRRQETERRCQKTALWSAFQTIGNDKDKRRAHERRDEAQLDRKPNRLPAGGVKAREVIIVEGEREIIGPEANEGPPDRNSHNHKQGEGHRQAKQEGRNITPKSRLRPIGHGAARQRCGSFAMGPTIQQEGKHGWYQ